MADASCSGPSPFKRLVDHQSRDVSHHQDRLVDRSASQPHGSFRSARHQPASSDGYSAFMDSAQSPMPGMPHDPANRLAVHAAALQPAPIHHLDASQQSRASPVPDIANWAADFTRFTTQQPQQHIRHPGAPSSTAQINHQPAAMHMNFQPAFGQAFGSPMYGGPQAGFMGAAPQVVEPDFDKEMSRWMSNHGNNMSEVDAAMDQMARELELNEAVLPSEAQTTTEQQQTVQETESTSRYTDLETPEIGNLSLRESQLESNINADVEAEQAVNDENAATKGKSAVSEAAERLLESVQHENGEKWQNSVFLSLMRDFRDGRKDIVDNEIRAMEGEEESGEPQQAAT